MAIVAVFVATLSGQLTTLPALASPPTVSSTVPGLAKGSDAGTAAGGATKGHKHKGATGPGYPVTVPTNAEPLLKTLLATAGQIDTENQRAATLSEAYDQQTIELKAAEAAVAKLDAQAAAAQRQVGAATLRLRNAAILAYVTGQISAMNAPIMNVSVNLGGMAAVYSASATNNLQAALNHFEAVENVISADRAKAQLTQQSISLQLAHVRSLRDTALGLMKRASLQYLAVSAKLLELVGKTEFARLFSPWPAKSVYKGPNLAGIDAQKPAPWLRGFAAAKAAKKYLGVP